MPTYRRHVFVCTNERPADNPKGCCKHKGGAEVRDRFKKELTRAGIGDRVRANQAGCLDQCEHGVSVVIYPEQVWYGGVTPDDVPEIVSRHIVGGEYVSRLLLPNQPHLGGALRGAPLEAGGDATPPGTCFDRLAEKPDVVAPERRDRGPD